MRDLIIEWRVLALVIIAVVWGYAEYSERENVVVAPPDVVGPEIGSPLAIVAPPVVPAAGPESAPAPPPASTPVVKAKVARKQRPARPPLAAPAPALPLETLLQVPPYAVVLPPEPEIDEVLKRLLAPESAGEEARKDEEAKSASKLGVDLGLRTDSPIERSDLKREQVDAAARLEVSKDTILKGGVRIERESSGGIESNRNTTPTIGIEKRF
jgi:hypothetical protein